MHNTFIRGYDNDNKNILIKDFYGVYKEHSIGYSEFNDAFKNRHDKSLNPGPYTIMLFEPQDSAYKLDIELTKRFLADYLNGTDSFSRMTHNYKIKNKEYEYGLNYYNLLLKRIKNKSIDIRAFHVLYDHKRLMLVRLEYLNGMQCITGGDFASIYDGYRRIRQDTLIMRNMALKYNINKDEGYLQSIVKKCADIKEEDAALTERLIKAL